MAEPRAIGMVLAMLVDPAGKPLRGGSAKGQLYATRDALVVLRPKQTAQILDRLAMVLLVGSIVAVVVNVFTWKSGAVLWTAVGAQALYWILLPSRRRAFEAQPLDDRALAEARVAGRVAIEVPARKITRTVAPEPPKRGFRQPARFELPEGAFEIYLSNEQWDELSAALGPR